MKRYFIYLSVVVIMLIAVAIFYVVKKESKVSPLKSLSINEPAQNMVEPSYVESKPPAQSIPDYFDNFTYGMSQAICAEEKEALKKIIYPSLNDLKSGDIVPDSDVILSTDQAILLLKKTSTSKCSSFRKNNAEEFFAKFTLNQNNLSEYYAYSNRELSNHTGFDFYRLIKKALQTYEKSNGQEAQHLRDMILYSLKIFIKDASSTMEIIGLANALKEAQEKGLLSYPNLQQINEVKEQLVKLADNDVKKGQERIKRYFLPDTNFLQITEQQMIDAYGYQGFKEEFEQNQNTFNEVKKISQQLSTLLDKNF